MLFYRIWFLNCKGIGTYLSYCAGLIFDNGVCPPFFFLIGSVQGVPQLLTLSYSRSDLVDNPSLTILVLEIRGLHD